jgi:hypothetical protein
MPGLLGLTKPRAHHIWHIAVFCTLHRRLLDQLTIALRTAAGCGSMRLEEGAVDPRHTQGLAINLSSQAEEVGKKRNPLKAAVSVALLAEAITWGSGRSLHTPHSAAVHIRRGVRSTGHGVLKVLYTSLTDERSLNSKLLGCHKDLMWANKGRECISLLPYQVGTVHSFLSATCATRSWRRRVMTREAHQ